VKKPERLQFSIATGATRGQAIRFFLNPEGVELYYSPFNPFRVEVCAVPVTTGCTRGY